MSPGKAAAQAGHAFLDAFLSCLELDPGRAAAYADVRPSTKITLAAPGLDVLEHLSDRLRLAGLPSALIVDSGHVELPDFDGSPIVTALGVGPLTRAEGRRLLSRFPLWGSPPTGHPAGTRLLGATGPEAAP